MPLYEYKCRKCGTVTEVLFRSSRDDQELRCTHCGSGALDKILSSPSIVNADKARDHGKTCCGRDDRCDTPPCSTSGACFKS